ncbi:MAG: HAD-IA family hydrolase, partial [Nanobdellota archaeon]
PMFKIPMLIFEAQKIQLKSMSKMGVFRNMPKVVRELSDKYRLGILSSNSKKVIERFIHKHNISEDFEFIKGYVKLFGKTSALKSVIKDYGLKKEEVLYIGDEVRDIEATKKAGVDMGAVTWGLNAEKLLREYDPKYIIRKPDDLLEILT